MGTAVQLYLTASNMVSKLVASLAILPVAIILAQHPYAPVPHHGYCDPKTPPKCAEGSDIPYCIADDEYPTYEVANKISADPIFLKKYADIADQSADDLVQDITKEQEEGFDYSYYTGASKGDSKYDATHWIGAEGYGSYNYTQTTRLETCEYPDSACRLLAPCYQSKCTQKYVFHRMLALNPCDLYRGFFIDTYKLP